MLMSYVVTFIDFNGFTNSQDTHCMIAFNQERRKTNLFRMKNWFNL